MLKSIQIKIIIIVVILSIIMFGGMGVIYIYNLEQVKDLFQDQNFIETQIQFSKTILTIVTISFVIISTTIIIFASKMIMKPIYKLIKSANQVTEGEETEINIKYLENGKTEIDELVKAFNLMTNGLKENLNEVTRQKKQIETILLHMTDGIIAFNLDGSIIHINPAASRLLKITSNDDTFDKIFKKLNIDINMEKIIYLENWTSTEQKVNVDDLYINMFFAPFKDENDRPSRSYGISTRYYRAC